MKGEKAFEQVRNILIIRNGALGDFIVTLPVITSLKKAFPSAQIALMGNHYFFNLAKPHVNTLIPSDLSGGYTLFCPDGEFPENIKRLFSRIDLVVSYTPDPEGTFIKNLGKIGIPWIVDGGFSPLEKLSTPITDFLLSPLKREGIPVFFEPPKIVPSFGDKKIAEEFFQLSGGCGEGNYPVMAIHPGSGSSKKCWPKEKFVALIRWAKRYLGATILLISGPADKDIFEAIWPSIKGCSPLVAKNLPLNHLAAILERCNVYVGNDSGITHLAASVGTPTLALFGPTDFRIWGPRNDNVKCLSGIYPCAPCAPKQMADCRDQYCLDSLRMTTVKKDLLTLFSRFCFTYLTSKNTRRLKEKENYV
ncbi:MAG TPA: glycosyltransferase family 9 protein [Thermodesulfobacteriota bacterium]|nr:glycosyltransferase family 9 protein [Thermodesulfobacteriota bacterium]